MTAASRKGACAWHCYVHLHTNRPPVLAIQRNDPSATCQARATATQVSATCAGPRFTSAAALMNAC
jgi:short subunit dehydrogenase-like uncharacterized protein